MNLPTPLKRCHVNTSTRIKPASLLCSHHLLLVSNPSADFQCLKSAKYNADQMHFHEVGG